MKDKAVVLMYHRVLPSSMLEKTFSSDGIVLRDKSFAKQLLFIKNNFKVVNIEEFVLFLNGETNFSKPVCLITFDDGWFDNYAYAFPLLKKYNVPATIFLTYDFINKNEPFWQEKINRYIKTKMSEINPKKIEKIHSEILNEFSLDKKVFRYLSHPDYFVKELVQYLKSHKYEKILSIVELCDKDVNDGLEYYPDVFLKWDQITEMKKHEMRFESHGLTHKILPNLSDEQKYYEISESKKILEERLNTNIVCFSYPNGDYDETTVNITKKCGYQLAFTTENGTINKNDNRFKLKRINIHKKGCKNIPLFYSTILNIFN